MSARAHGGIAVAEGRAARADLDRVRAHRPAPATVNVSVDATAAGTPLVRVWAFHGYDEINYTTDAGRKGVARHDRRRAHRARARAQPLPPQHRRRHAGAEVGIDERLHRGRRREPGLQLGPDRRDHGHHHRGRRVSVRRARLHARGALDAPDPLPQLQQHAARRRVLLSPDRLREVGGSHPRVGDARERALPGRRGELAVGAVERARLRLLARHVRRIRAALRLHGSGAARGDAERGARWPGGGGRRQRLPEAIPPALRDRHQRRHRRDRDAPGSRDLPREGRRRHRRGPRPDEPRHTSSGFTGPASTRSRRSRSSSRRRSTSPRRIPTAAPPARRARCPPTRTATRPRTARTRSR